MIADLIDCDVLPDRRRRPLLRRLRRHRRPQLPGAGRRRPTRDRRTRSTSIEQYDTVLVGSPIWNVRTPMIMTTFTDSHDFTGKTVHPFVTYAVSGLGSTEQDYAAGCPEHGSGQGLAVQGEEVAEHRGDVDNWLRAARLRKA